jgi:hypothetical protein
LLEDSHPHTFANQRYHFSNVKNNVSKPDGEAGVVQRVPALVLANGRLVKLSLLEMFAHVTTCQREMITKWLDLPSSFAVDD